MLFNEPKLLKSEIAARLRDEVAGFSALQRAEIAEIDQPYLRRDRRERFSALQRAEIAEIKCDAKEVGHFFAVSVLFNEPKLLKSTRRARRGSPSRCFSALQRAEIAEIVQ